MNESHGYHRGHPPAELPSEVTMDHLLRARAILDAAPIPEPDKFQVARMQGFTGDICSQCGGVHMQMAGHCMVCADCGTTTGCS